MGAHQHSRGDQPRDLCSPCERSTGIGDRRIQGNPARFDRRRGGVTRARKIRANRANARASSGPKTAAGKAQSAQNAFRHGFNVPIWLDPNLPSDVEALAQRIVGEGAAANVLAPARRVAPAQIDLGRVRSYRDPLIERAMPDSSARVSKIPRSTTAAGSYALSHSRRNCRQFWRSSPRTSRRSFATTAAPRPGENSSCARSTSRVETERRARDARAASFSGAGKGD